MLTLTLMLLLIEISKQSVNPEVGADLVWSRKYAGATPATLTMLDYFNRRMLA